MLKLFHSLLRSAIGATLLLWTAGAVLAQDITVSVGYGRILNFVEPVTSVFVGTDALVSIQAITPSSIFITGLAPGFTNLMALNEENELIVSRTVEVVPESRSTAALLAGLLPSNSISIKRIGDTDILIGNARTVDEAFAAVTLRQQLEQSGRNVIDQTTVSTPTQIGVRVRIVELYREQIQNLGFDITAFDQSAPFRVVAGSGVASDFLAGTKGIGGNSIRAGAGFTSGDLDVNVVLDALESRGLVQILSEPVLTTVSGRKATFTAGSEFASPVNQGDGVITNEYRRTGISIDILPTIMPNGRIALDINPKMSFANPGNGSINGAPTLQIRETNTSVEVASGQTFAIAGLHEQVTGTSEQTLPGFMRRIFTNRQTTRNEREVIFFVTPYYSDGTTKEAPKRHVPVRDTIGFILK